MAARNRVTNSYIVNSKVNGWPSTIPTNTKIGTTKSAICVPEPAAIPIDRSFFLFLQE